MTQVTINVPESKLSFFLELVKNLGFAKNVKTQSEEESPYNPEFVAKIEQGRKDYKEGKGTKITIEELNDLWK